MKSVRWRTAEEELSYVFCKDSCDDDKGAGSREDADQKMQVADPVANYVFDRDEAGLRAFVSELLEKVPEVRAFVQLKLDIEAELRKKKTIFKRGTGMGPVLAHFSGWGYTIGVTRRETKVLCVRGERCRECV